MRVIQVVVGGRLSRDLGSSQMHRVICANHPAEESNEYQFFRGPDNNWVDFKRNAVFRWTFTVLFARLSSTQFAIAR